MKKVILLFVALVLVLSACANVTPQVVEVEKEVVKETAFKEAQKGQSYFFVHTNRQHPVVRIMMAGFFKACEDYGVSCQDMGVDQEDIAGEIAMMEQAVALGSSGILYTIHDDAEIAPGLTAIEKGIPIVNGHFPIEYGDVPGLLAWAAPDNVGYAKEVAYAMAEKLQCQGKVSVTQGGLNEGENAVSAAFIDALKGECGDAVEILDIQIEEYDAAKAESVTSAIIQANPDLDGAFSTTGGGAKAWANGLKANGKKAGEVVVIGMDYSRENLDLVKSGEVYMLVGQPLFEEMYYGTSLLILNSMGYPVPYTNTLPAPLITIDNVDKYFAINDLAESIEIK